MNVVNVELQSNGYPIHIAHGLFRDAKQILNATFAAQDASLHHAVVVSDSKVADLYLDSFKSVVSDVFDKVDSMVVQEGETSKSVSQAEELWTKLVDFGADRNTVIIALGGGVVGDLAGFLAATYGRGVPFIQIPTTLLAQVDSSVGGKVGINLPSAKNIVGAFWQPVLVMIDTQVLETLSDRDFNSGMAEVIKYGAIMDAPFFEFLESSADLILNRDHETLNKVIRRCCELKAQVVVEDEKERSGRRAILNYGHTYGHAIESVFGYGEFSHGEAIAIGMNCAARLAIQMEICHKTLLSRQTALLTKFGLPVDCPSERHSELLSAMKRDKKVQNGTLMLVLPTKIGHVQLIPAPDNESLLQSIRCE